MNTSRHVSDIFMNISRKTEKKSKNDNDYGSFRCNSSRFLSRPLFRVFLVTPPPLIVFGMFASRNREAITLRQLSAAGV